MACLLDSCRCEIYPYMLDGVISISYALLLYSEFLGVSSIPSDPFRLDLPGENSVSLSANHLQKLRLSFQLTTPVGNSFKPHQVWCSFYLLIEWIPSLI